MSVEINFKNPRVFVFIGRCGMGKSFLLRNLIYQFTKAGQLHFGVVFTGTDMSKDYEFMPEKAVRSDYSEKNLEKYIDKLKVWIKSNPGKKLPMNFLILDDLLGRIRVNSPVFQNLITTYRHLNMNIFLTSQYMVRNTPTLVRELTDYAFIFKTRFKNSLVSLYEAFGQMLESQEEFNRLLEEATKEQYTALMYDANKETAEEAYTPFRCDQKDIKFKLDFEPVSF